jgi:hypothetical protein
MFQDGFIVPRIGTIGIPEGWCCRSQAFTIFEPLGFFLDGEQKTPTGYAVGNRKTGNGDFGQIQQNARFCYGMKNEFETKTGTGNLEHKIQYFFQRRCCIKYDQSCSS